MSEIEADATPIDTEMGDVETPANAYPICNHCGSDRVVKDAWAVWDPETQRWELGEAFDYSFCLNCERESKPEWKTQPR